MSSSLSSRYGTSAERAAQLPADPEVLTLRQCAAVLQIHPVTLSIWRREGKGPPACNLADSDKAVRYLRSDVLAWVAMQRRPSKKVCRKREIAAALQAEGEAVSV